MNWEEVFSGSAGPAGLYWALNSPASRRLLRKEAQKMLRPGFHAGSFHLTRAKFKPGRKLLAYFLFSAIDGNTQHSDPLHLAVEWQNEIEGDRHQEDWSQLQEEANRSGLMPVQTHLWRELPERNLRLQLWPFDPKFPQLVRLGNPAYVAKMLAALGITSDLQQLPVVIPIRYRPKERHVLRYEFSLPSTASENKQRLYAKLYTNADDTSRAFGVANRVVDWLTANPVGLQGNRPEAMSETDCVILYPHASGVPLSHQLHRSRRWLSAQLQVIGRGLAALHSGPESLQVGLKRNDFAKEAKVVKRASEHIQILLPETYNKIIGIVDKAQEYYSALPQEKPTFTHSDFKSDHLLTTAQGLTLIDFDTCTLTDPALDIGKFLADLEWWFTRKGIPDVEEAQAAVLKGYVGDGEPGSDIRERLRRSRAFQVLILTKIIVRRVPIYKKEWAEETERMVEKAAQVLDKAIQA